MGYYIERSSFPFKDSDKDRPSCVVGHTETKKDWNEKEGGAT